MGLELYLDLFSPPCRAVYIFAKKNNIPFDFKAVELFKDSILGTKGPDTKSPEGATQAGPGTKITLTKKVPVLKDEAFSLADSTAILLYLSRKYKTPDHWYPSDIQKRAKVDEYLSWHQGNIRVQAPQTVWIKVLIPLFTGQPFSSDKLQRVMGEMAVSLRQFEEQFLQDQPFLVGREISLADLVAVVELMQPVAAGCDIFEGRPRLTQWRKRVEEAIGKEVFLQAHELILNIHKLSTIQIDPRLKEQVAPTLLKMLQ
uniref:glutathione transferase n=1 Tax=Salvator merianae TaxID=96440 RepID=A0A8D0AZD1_SALMN